jgi:hypothetical protein
MTQRRLSAHIDALADGKRPGSFDADPDDVEVLRTAITLRSSRPGDAIPDRAFVAGLLEDLAERAEAEIVPMTRPVKARRRHTALAAVAAGLVVVGGTAAATEAFGHTATSPAALSAPRASSIRTGTFETSDGRVMGQIVASRGDPSWVFMSVGGTNYTGQIVCNLQVDNGSTVATGAFTLHDGKGVWSKPIHVDIGRLRGANLVTPSGAVVASATFA